MDRRLFIVICRWETAVQSVVWMTDACYGRIPGGWFSLILLLPKAIVARSIWCWPMWKSVEKRCWQEKSGTGRWFWLFLRKNRRNWCLLPITTTFICSFPICVTDWHSARLLTVCFLRTKNGKWYRLQKDCGSTDWLPENMPCRLSWFSRMGKKGR